MDITKLPFNTEEMLAGLKPWIECESPTYDPSGSRSDDGSSRL